MSTKQDWSQKLVKSEVTDIVLWRLPTKGNDHHPSLDSDTESKWDSSSDISDEKYTTALNMSELYQYQEGFGKYLASLNLIC